MTSKEAILTYDVARELFDYNPDGHLTWANPRNKRKIKGERVGGRRKDGRQQVMLSFDGKSHLFLISRIIWLLHHGEWPRHTIDHIDYNAQNDRIENLRDISQKGNNENRKAALCTSATGVLGVHAYCRDPARYRANIGITDENGKRKQIYLGLFDSVEEAEVAYQQAKLKYHKYL